MRERIDEYLTYLSEEEKYSANTTAAYRNDLSQFFEWLQEQGYTQSGWASVGPEQMTEFLFYLREREYAPSTIARKMAAIKSYFHHLVEREEIVEDPTENVDSPKVKKFAPQALSRDGIVRLMTEAARVKNLKGLRDRAMLELLYSTGLRVSELVNLTIADVSVAQWTVRCGTGANARVVPVSPRAMGALTEYLEEGRVGLAREGDEVLFVNMRGGRLTRQGLWLIIKHYVQQAGIKVQVTPHTLRHSFAIHRLKEGSELSELQELLGHANISTTQAYNQGRDDQD
ncbi:MAG TPA: tyrosine-type recombinase/integrase [Ardenticatenaceae bacterium]|jgi:integrase/recombinase XerD